MTDAPCVLCGATQCRHKRNDAAVLAHRADPTEENRQAVLAAMGATVEDFYEEQTVEFIERTKR